MKEETYMNTKISKSAPKKVTAMQPASRPTRPPNRKAPTPKPRPLAHTTIRPQGTSKRLAGVELLIITQPTQQRASTPSAVPKARLKDRLRGSPFLLVRFSCERSTLPPG